MNQKYNSELEDELRDEYDFNDVPIIARGRNQKQLNQSRLQEKLEISIMSESSLGKDWLKPEEDEAWKDL